MRRSRSSSSTRSTRTGPILVIIVSVSPRRAAVLGFVYAVLQGFCLGAISASFNAQTEGIVGAVQEVGIEVPVVVRLVGNNAERGREILNQSGLKLIAAEGLTEAAEKIVAAVRG